MKIFLLLSYLMAAPYPATVSSPISSNNSYFKSDWGFEIQQNTLSWLRIVPEGNDPYFLATYKPYVSAPESQASLSVRVDPVSDRSEETIVSLKSYVSHWTNQYPRLGLEVLKTSFDIRGGKDVAVVDVINPETQIQIRQFVYWADNNAVVFSCRDQKASFSVSAYACEQIVDSVNWK